MAIFGKGGDLLDYTYLQKRGLIKKSPEDKHEKVVRTKDGFVDLSNIEFTKKEPSSNKIETNVNSFGGLFESAENAQNNSTSVSNENSSSQDLGFLNFLDSPSSNKNLSNNLSSNDLGLSNSDISAMKIKVEDLEYKLTNLLDKLSLVESKLSSFEKKVFNKGF